MEKLKILLLIGIIGFAAFPLLAQKKLPYSFQHQADLVQQGKLQEVTQVNYPNTTSIRLYFEDTQLGNESYLLLEGIDGAQQKLDAEGLKNWRNSSAYFNGGQVKVSLYQAPGDLVTFRIKELKVNEEIKGREAQARKITAPPTATANIGEFNQADLPHAAAVGRFTNGSNSFGTGWIAPNGAIVTSESVMENVAWNGYDIIEFNVPPSNSDGSVNHPGPQHQYPVVASPFGDNNNFAVFSFKKSKGYEAENEPGLEISAYRTTWAIVEALPNGTGLRPGERQQQYFRIATNPGSFTLDAMDVEVDIFHYGSYPEDIVHPEDYRTLRMTTTKLLVPKNNIHRVRYLSDGNIESEHMLIYHKKGDDPFSSAMGAPITYHQSNVAIGVHHTFYVHAPAGAVGFKNNLFRDKLNNYFTSNVVYVDAEGLYGNNSTGEIHKPYVQLSDGINNAPEDATIYIAKGSYNESVTINTPMTLKAPVGIVRIGTSQGNNTRIAQVALPSELFVDDEESSFDDFEAEIVEGSSLQSYPNPFTDRTEVRYSLAEEAPVVVKVYNILGIEVNTLVEEVQTEGEKSVVWDGRNALGGLAETGVYIIQIQTGEEMSTVRVIKK